MKTSVLILAFSCLLCFFQEAKAQNQNVILPESSTPSSGSEIGIKSATQVTSISNSSNTVIIDGRKVEVDAQGIQNLAVPEKKETATPIKNESSPQ
jgi:hypothetical protein